MCNAFGHPPDCRCGFGPPYPFGDPDRFLRGVDAARRRIEQLLGAEWDDFRPKLDALIGRTERAEGSEARQRAAAAVYRLGSKSAAAQLFAAIAQASLSAADMAALEEALRQPDQPERELMAEPLDPEPTSDVSDFAMAYSATELDFDDAPATLIPLLSSSFDVDQALLSAIPPSGPLDASSRSGHAEPPAPPAAPATPATPGEPRFANLCFTGKDSAPVLASAPLVADLDYRLRMDIGPLSKDSIVTNAAANPVRADLLPPSEDGHWLKVVATSRQFDVSPTGRWLFLPTSGAAWSCGCQPEGPHTCQPAKRQAVIMCPVHAPSATGEAALRVTLYHQRSVVQSLQVTATIARSAAEPGTNAAVVDYNLTESLTDLGATAPRAMSVMMNDANDGTHTLVFNGLPDEAVALTVTDGQMSDALRTTRELMRRIHIKEPARPGAAPTNRFDDDNAKTREAFIADLRELATWGWSLWNTLWQPHVTFWRKNRTRFVGESDAVQVARKKGSTTIFPWAAVYDIPIDTGAPERNPLCQLLEEPAWRTFVAGSPALPVRCPFEASHPPNVICPYGFWGYRYEIEQPPSLEIGQPLRRTIPAAPLPLDILLALSDELDAGLRDRHLAALRRQHPKFTFSECHTREAIRKGLAHPHVEVAYFYCHGRSDPLPGGAGTTPSLGVGVEEVIAPPDLGAWSMEWPLDHWSETAPLVFINGCHTADTCPQTLVNFVDTFSAMLHAGGVIGTEITVHQRVANEMAESLLDAFQRGASVGRALRTARTRLLRKGNLLGLVYTAYCSADFRLATSVA